MPTGGYDDEYTTLLPDDDVRKPSSSSLWVGTAGGEDDTSLGMSATDNVNDNDDEYDQYEYEYEMEKNRSRSRGSGRDRCPLTPSTLLAAVIIVALTLLAAVAVAYWMVHARRDGGESSTMPLLPDIVANGGGGNSPTNSKYTKVRYFGFQIYTGGAPAYLEDAASNFNDDDDDDGGGNDGDVDGATTTTATNKNYMDNSGKTPNPECIRSPSFGQVLLGANHPELRCYLGHKDPLVDVQKRLTIMRQAVERAYNESLVDDNDDDDDEGEVDGSNGNIANNKNSKDNKKTLNLFVAPEFYWRGLEGAYSFVTLDRVMTDQEHCRGPICSILRGLEEIVEDARFEDWFFVFGSIVASQVLVTPDMEEEGPTTTGATRNNSNNRTDYLYYNFAPVYKGYDPKKIKKSGGVPVGKRFLLPKRYIASNDFLTPHADRVAGMDWDWSRQWQEVLGPNDDNRPNTTDNPFYGPNNEKRLRYDYDDLFAKYKKQLYDDAGYAIIEYDWLMMDGLTLSLEVCFDHQKKTALNTYLGDIIGGRTTRIPSSSDDEDGCVGRLDYVPIPSHQAQISLVSSAGMTVVADSLALTNHGTIFLQDGLSNVTARQYLDDDMRYMCDQGLQFEGGTEAVTRRVVVSPTDVTFLYDVIRSERKVPLYGDDGGGADADNDDAWRDALKDAYTAVIYEPHLIVHKSLDIAPVRDVVVG